MTVTVWQFGDSQRFNTHHTSGTHKTQKPVVSVNGIFGMFFFCALRFTTYPSQGRLCSLFKHNFQSWEGNYEAACPWMWFWVHGSSPFCPPDNLNFKFSCVEGEIPPGEARLPFSPTLVLNARVILTSPVTARSGPTPRPATIPLTGGHDIGRALSLGP